MDKTAFISDIHGNAVALKTVLEDIRNQGCMQIFVLGDVINGMDPSRCIAMLKKIDNIAYIKGNAEHYVLTPDLDAFPKRDESYFPGLLSVIGWWHEHMSQADFETIRSWPDFLQLDGFYLVHDSPSDQAAVKQIDLGGIDEKYRDILFHGKGIPKNMPANELDQILEFMEQKNVSGLFIGHTHEPYITHIDERVICNAGSVGFNLDGDPRPSWIFCEDSENGQEFSVRRVAYDIDMAIQRLIELDFLIDADERNQTAYIKMLQTGIHWRAHM